MTDCYGTAWMVTDAASAISQMAAAMSGFVLAGTIVLLSQPRASTENGSGPTASARLRALLPFVATFITMGLTSYIFALISGEQANSCRRVWTAAVVGSGMLAVGAVATVCGLIMLVEAYLARRQLSGGDRHQLRYLERVLTLTLRLLTVVTAFLLLQRAYEYLRVWYGGSVDTGWLWFVAVIVVLVAVVVATMAPRLLATLMHPVIGRKGDDYDRLLSFAAGTTVVYSIVGTAVVGFSLGVVPSDWSTAPGTAAWAIAVFAVAGPFLAVAAYTYSIRNIAKQSDDAPGDHDRVSTATGADPADPPR